MGVCVCTHVVHRGWYAVEQSVFSALSYTTSPSIVRPVVPRLPGEILTLALYAAQMESLISRKGFARIKPNDIHSEHKHTQTQRTTRREQAPRDADTSERNATSESLLHRHDGPLHAILGKRKICERLTVRYLIRGNCVFLCPL